MFVSTLHSTFLRQLNKYLIIFYKTSYFYICTILDPVYKLSQTNVKIAHHNMTVSAADNCTQFTSVGKPSFTGYLTKMASIYFIPINSNHNVCPFIIMCTHDYIHVY